MSPKLVSVLTPLWGCPEKVNACMQLVAAQTYRPIEHVLVVDGPDPSLVDKFYASMFRHIGQGIKYKIEMLGRNWSTYLEKSFGVAPLVVASMLASGDYQMWFCDDEQMTPDHVEKLVGALEATQAGFAYSRTRLVKDTPDGPFVWDVGSMPPKKGQITNFLYRTDLLKKNMFRFHQDEPGDWDMIRQWLEAGVPYAFVDELTFTHHVDH